MIPHSQCLRSICRLCGVSRAVVAGRNPILKEKFAKQIFIALNIAIQDDVSDVHPQFICKVCEVKLRQWWSKFSHKHIKTAKCNIILASFDSSDCEGCKEAAQPLTLRLDGYKEEAIRCNLVTWFSTDFLKIMKMSSDSDGNPIVCVNIFSDFSWQLKIADVFIQDDPFQLKIPVKMSTEDCKQLCSFISQRVVCAGNDDFPDLVELKRGPEGQIPVSITPKDEYCNGTIRHKCCKMMLEEGERGRCDVCRIHRSDLASMVHRLKKKEENVVTASSTMPHVSMSYSQLQQKADSVQAERRSLKRRSAFLQDKIATMLEVEAISVGNLQDESLKETMRACNDEIMAEFPEESPARLMWDQQKESAMKGKQMRWHPAIIRLCIALHSKSSSAYNLMRDSGFMRLPHESSLHPYSHFADISPGFSHAMLDRIVSDHHLHSCPEQEKHVSVLFDEMKVKSGLVYSVRSDEIVGFTDITEVSNEVLDFECRCKGEEKSNEATHVLVLMVRGLFSSLHAPIAYYSTRGVTSSQLYPCVTQAITYLEFVGFNVWSLVCDGASPNRKFYKLHGEGTIIKPTYKTQNPFDEKRSVFFICDTPHLMKTTRNNLENSGYNNKTRQLFYDEQIISWTHLLELYEWDIGLQRTSPGLRRLHKISYDHLHLTPSLRMRVYMATQVLSTTVANALEGMGRPGTASTVKFLRLMDQFFDCLNVSNPIQGMCSRKPALEPYTSPDDWRFKWLLDDFLGFFKDWEKQVQDISDLSKQKRQSMCLSKETIEGLRITVHSFVELATTLLASSGVTYFLSEKLNQDPLEEYFSKQRGAGGSWDNPTVEQFGHNMLALYVASSSAKASRKGNIRKRDQHVGTNIDSTPLPKRKKKSNVHDY